MRALEQRRAFFKSMGATATDHGVQSPYTAALGATQRAALFERALRGTATPDDTTAFTGHMLMEMARMSIDDGLVMQLHAGSLRNHNQPRSSMRLGQTPARISRSQPSTRAICSRC